MNTPELKVGQRFLVKSGTDIIEYSVQEITADGKYHRISPATGPYSQWVELRTLDIIHVFEAPKEKTEWLNQDEFMECLKGAADMNKSIERLKSIPLTVPSTREGRRKCLLDIADKMDAIVKEFSAEQKPVTVTGLDPAWNKGDKTMIATAEVTEDGIKVTDIREARETYQRLQSQGAISATPINPGFEGKPPELLKPAE